MVYSPFRTTVIPSVVSRSGRLLVEVAVHRVVGVVVCRGCWLVLLDYVVYCASLVVFELLNVDGVSCCRLPGVVLVGSPSGHRFALLQ